MKESKARAEFIKRSGFEPTPQELDNFIKNNYDLFQDKNNTKKSNPVATVLILLWIGLSVVGILLPMSKVDLFGSALVFAQFFAVLFSLIILGNSTYYFIPIIIGILFNTFVQTGLHLVLLDFNLGIIGRSLFGYGITICVFAIGMYLSIKKHFSPSNKKTFKVDAEVINYLENDNTVACVYKYTVDGITYENTDGLYTNVNVPEKGRIIKIEIDRNDYNKIYLKNSLMNIFYIVSLGLLFIGMIFIIVAFAIPE